MLDSHTREPRLLDLEGDQSSQVHVNLSFLGGVHTGVGCCGEDVEALITDLVDH